MKEKYKASVALAISVMIFIISLYAMIAETWFYAFGALVGVIGILGSMSALKGADKNDGKEQAGQ
jgi:hypothetical protein